MTIISWERKPSIKGIDKHVLQRWWRKAGFRRIERVDDLFPVDEEERLLQFEIFVQALLGDDLAQDLAVQQDEMDAKDIAILAALRAWLGEVVEVENGKKVTYKNKEEKIRFVARMARVIFTLELGRFPTTEEMKDMILAVAEGKRRIDESRENIINLAEWKAAHGR